MSDIGTLIQQQLVTAITAACQTPFPPNDPTRANLVKRGEFQDDPEDYQVIICVHRNNPNGTQDAGQAGWLDERVEPEMGMLVGGGGIASPEYWTRRFVVEIHVWPTGQDQETAEDTNGIVIARVRKAVASLNIGGLSDGFGETVELCNPVERIRTDEGGGPDDEYHWTTSLFLSYGTIWRPT